MLFRRAFAPPGRTLSARAPTDLSAWAPNAREAELFVRHLPRQVSREQLRKAFEAVCPVRKVRGGSVPRRARRLAPRRVQDRRRGEDEPNGPKLYQKGARRHPFQARRGPCGLHRGWLCRGGLWRRRRRRSIGAEARPRLGRRQAHPTRGPPLQERRNRAQCGARAADFGDCGFGVLGLPGPRLFGDELCDGVAPNRRFRPARRRPRHFPISDLGGRGLRPSRRGEMDPEAAGGCRLGRGQRRPRPVVVPLPRRRGGVVEAHCGIRRS
mmetsp:Transcript_34695/g.120990  ORF Transcript_34695/g.120990 Transcript_34695/m.120990 type:complete len:268 (+) Transcript_34695:68-871(+)